MTTIVPARISGIRPRDSPNEDTGKDRAGYKMLLPDKSWGADSFRTRAGRLSNVVEIGDGSATDVVTLTGGESFSASTRPCANSSFLTAPARGADLSALPGVEEGDMRTNPRISSNDGAFPDGAIVCVTVGATRGGVSGAGAGSLGTTCGSAKTGVGGFKTVVCPVDWWMPQKLFTGSANSTSIYPFTDGRFRALATRQTTPRPCGFEMMTVWPGRKLPVIRRTAPLSNTITVLASSQLGLDDSEGASPFSPGTLRIVTGTSRQTGLDRGF
jgi:hypothetical protein